MRTALVVLYFVIGVVVAAAKDYLGDIGSVGAIVNLILAIVLWPLVLLGVDFNIDIGGGGDKGKDDKGKKGALFWIGPTAIYARARIATLRSS